MTPRANLEEGAASCPGDPAPGVLGRWPWRSAVPPASPWPALQACYRSTKPALPPVPRLLAGLSGQAGRLGVSQSCHTPLAWREEQTVGGPRDLPPVAPWALPLVLLLTANSRLLPMRLFITRPNTQVRGDEPPASGQACQMPPPGPPRAHVLCSQPRVGLRLPAGLYSHPWDVRPWSRTHVRTCLSSLRRAGPQGAGSRQGAAACLSPSPRAVALGRISARTPLLLQCLRLPCLPLPPLGEMCTILDWTVSPTASSGGSSDPPCDCVETEPPLPESPSPALPAGCAQSGFLPALCPPLPLRTLRSWPPSFWAARSTPGVWEWPKGLFFEPLAFVHCTISSGIWAHMCVFDHRVHP